MNHICKYCGKEFETAQKLGGHVSRCSLNPNKNQEKIHQKIKENFEKRNPLEEHVLKCQVCGTEYTLQIRHKQFEEGKYRKTCCLECAHKLTYLNSNIEERNKKISKSMIGKIPYIKDKHLENGNWITNNEEYKKVIRFNGYCKYCGKKILNLSKSQFCSDDCRNKSKHEKLSKISKENNFGGYHPNSIKKHHHGNYKGIHCDSSWELAYLVWCLEHNIKIERCNEIRYYKVNKQTRKYFPDFIVNNQIIEIKGYLDKYSQLKSEQNPDIKVLLKEDLNEMLNYVINKYGKKFWEILYE